MSISSYLAPLQGLCLNKRVCFYGKTAERVLSILATDKYRFLLPSGGRVRDCSDLDPKHFKSGVYTIKPAGGTGLKAYCDMETDGGGWTVFQRRLDGNDKLYKLTSRGQYELRVNLEDFNGDKAYAKYSNFFIGDKSTNYKLTVKGYSGTAGDCLKTHNDHAFSTKDKDNDNHSFENCAKMYKGAWWYYTCHVSNLNGLYVGNKKDDRGINWQLWKGSQSMKTTSMMIRRNRL
ncbi:Hypothetical predicted protein [Mytilus galloprovincialis]|uniref:Fibrinogen C-terminal domain-containing protein n=1 Tax=Mytilus galloprovincialis TaxID=29158 RepID=A0A8B6D1V8_MYTGA|nr:Hypothetical predicted protein [Mytilus galloprovincialis]